MFATRPSRLLAGILGLLALSSCASLSPSQAPSTYDLSAATALAAPERAVTQAQILIPEPTAIQTLDSRQIVVRPTPLTIEYLQDSQWSDRLPRMVQLRVLQAFQNTGRVGAVGVPGQGLAIDYQIVMEIRRFEIAVEGGARARIEISAKALNDRNGEVRATRIVQAEVPVLGSGNAAFIAALNEAFNRATDEVVGWTLGLI